MFKKIFFRIILFCIFYSIKISAIPTDLIPNWSKPTNEDLETIQLYLEDQFSKSNETPFGFRTNTIKSFKIYKQDRKPKGLQIEPFGEKKSSFCIICYSSFNERYEKGLNRLKDSLKKTGFCGDILNRVGEWPNMENGSLILCDIPYSFKLCAFQEALSLGYDQALWLDDSVIVLKDLTKIFENIKNNGAYFRKSKYPFNERGIINKQIAEGLNIPINDLKEMQHYAAGILGFDLTNLKIKNLLNDWYLLAKDGRSFYSCFPEQVPLSFLIHKYKLYNGLCSENAIVFDKKHINENTFFFVNYEIK